MRVPDFLWAANHTDGRDWTVWTVTSAASYTGCQVGPTNREPVPTRNTLTTARGLSASWGCQGLLHGLTPPPPTSKPRLLLI